MTNHDLLLQEAKSAVDCIVQDDAVDPSVREASMEAMVLYCEDALEKLELRDRYTPPLEEEGIRGAAPKVVYSWKDRVQLAFVFVITCSILWIPFSCMRAMDDAPEVPEEVLAEAITEALLAYERVLQSHRYQITTTNQTNEPTN